MTVLSIDYFQWKLYFKKPDIYDLPESIKVRYIMDTGRLVFEGDLVGFIKWIQLSSQRKFPLRYFDLE